MPKTHEQVKSGGVLVLRYGYRHGNPPLTKKLSAVDIHQQRKNQFSPIVCYSNSGNTNHIAGQASCPGVFDQHNGASVNAPYHIALLKLFFFLPY